MKRFVIAPILLIISTPVMANAAPSVVSSDHIRIVSEHSQATPGHPDRAAENYTAALSLFETDPAHWGGAYVDGDKLVINYVDQILGSAQSALTKAGVVGAVTLREGRTSLATFQAAKDAIHRDISTTAGITSVAPNYETGGLSVDSEESDPVALVKTLDEVVPTDLTVELKLGVRRGQPTTSRYYDRLSYNGGNGIALSTSDDSKTVNCSTAFNLTGSSDGYAYAVTAGHCYTYRKNGTAPFPKVKVHRSTGGNSGMGTVWTVSVGLDGTVSGRNGDLAIYRYTPVAGYTSSQMGNPMIYTGNGDAPLSSRRIVKGTVSLPKGYQASNIRTSGASGFPTGSTGQISPDWVSNVDVDWTYSDGFTVRNISVIEDVSECVSLGDSGAPSMTPPATEALERSV